MALCKSYGFVDPDRFCDLYGGKGGKNSLFVGYIDAGVVDLKSCLDGVVVGVDLFEKDIEFPF